MPARRHRGSNLTRLAGGVLLAVALLAAPASASWSPAVNVSPSMPGSSDPDVAVGGGGLRAATWVHGDGVNHRVQFSVRSGGAWTQTLFASRAGSDASDPHVAVDAGGDAVF